MSVQKVSKRKTAEKEAREKIAEIRRNGFDPGDEPVMEAIDRFSPERARLILKAAARAYREFVPLH